MVMTGEPLPKINLDRCTGCGRCIAICPAQVLTQRNGKAYLHTPVRCTYCSACEEVCPEDAIALPFLIVVAERGGEPMTLQPTPKEGITCDGLSIFR